MFSCALQLLCVHVHYGCLCVFLGSVRISVITRCFFTLFQITAKTSMSCPRLIFMYKDDFAMSWEWMCWCMEPVVSKDPSLSRWKSWMLFHDIHISYKSWEILRTFFFIKVLSYFNAFVELFFWTWKLMLKCEYFQWLHGCADEAHVPIYTCMCVYIYTYIYIYIYIHTYIHIHIHIYTYICICIMSLQISKLYITRLLVLSSFPHHRVDTRKMMLFFMMLFSPSTAFLIHPACGRIACVSSQVEFP
jgi:hypothetical protein